MLTLTWVFGATTIIGLVLTIFYGRKSAQLEIARKKIDWADMQSCANDLGSEIKKVFLPDVILTPGLRGATFANLLVEEFQVPIPVIVGISTWKSGSAAPLAGSSFLTIETSKWYVHIPKYVLQYKQRKLLIVDDFAMSGDFLERLKGLLLSNGFKEDSIRSACMVTTKVAVHARKSPDYFWMQTPDDSFYFPWGRAK